MKAKRNQILVLILCSLLNCASVYAYTSSGYGRSYDKDEAHTQAFNSAMDAARSQCGGQIHTTGPATVNFTRTVAMGRILWQCTVTLTYACGPRYK